MVRLVREHERCSLVVSVLGSGAKISRKEISRKEKKIPTHPPSLFPPTHRVCNPSDRSDTYSAISKPLHGNQIGTLSDPFLEFPFQDYFTRGSQDQDQELTVSVFPSTTPTATNVGG